jgi:hypothetical protein
MEQWFPHIACAGFIVVFCYAWYLDYKRDQKRKAYEKMKMLGNAGHRWTHNDPG